MTLDRVGWSLGSIDDGTVRSCPVAAVAEHAAVRWKDGGAFEAIAVHAARGLGAGPSSDQCRGEVDGTCFSSMQPGRVDAEGPFDVRMAGCSSLACSKRQHSSCRNEGGQSRSGGSRSIVQPELILPLVRSGWTRWSRKLRAPGAGSIPGCQTALTTKRDRTKRAESLKRPVPPRRNRPPPTWLSSMAAARSAPGTQAAPRRARAAPRPGPAGRSRSARPTHARCSRRRRSPGSTGCRSRRRCRPGP